MTSHVIKKVMLRTYVYIPDELEIQIVSMAKLKGESKAVVIRRALTAGVSMIKDDTNTGVYTLNDLVKIADKYKADGPKDLSKNMDNYLWGITNENK